MKIDENSNAKKEKLKGIIPFVKEYAAGRGTHKDQAFYNKNNMYYNNAVSAIIRNGELYRTPQGVSYCYATLFRRYVKGETILLQVQLPHEDQNKEAFRHYIEWVINYSPWRDMFISKNINRILKEGVIVLDGGDNSVARVKEAAIAVRMAWENYAGNHKYKEIDLWWEVTQKVDPKLSFLAGKLMFAAQKIDDNKIFFKNSDSGHSPINYHMGSDNYHLTGWYLEKATRGGWSTAKKRGSLTRAIHNIANNIGKNDVVINPFPNTAVTSVIKREAFIEAMYSELPKLGELYNV